MVSYGQFPRSRTKSLWKIPNANHVRQIAGAAWSSGKQGNAMSGNHQTNESLTLTINWWFAWWILLQEIRACTCTDSQGNMAESCKCKRFGIQSLIFQWISVLENVWLEVRIHLWYTFFFRSQGDMCASFTGQFCYTCLDSAWSTPHECSMSFLKKKIIFTKMLPKT